MIRNRSRPGDDGDAEIDDAAVGPPRPGDDGDAKIDDAAVGPPVSNRDRWKHRDRAECTLGYILLQK
jgi:hypothetical protein